MTFLTTLSGYLWGLPLILLLLGTGTYLTILLRGLQFRLLGHAFWLAFVERKEPGGEGDISHFQALMTALAATVGTGNIAGVATAIAIGGPGAVFWMWCTGLVGMITKYAEALLAVRYRYRDEEGEMVGGPMVYIRSIGKAPAWGWIASAFAFFVAFASFGVGNMVQAHSVADAMEAVFEIRPGHTGIVLGILTGAVVLGGIKWIGRAASLVVPVMIVLYCTAALGVLVAYVDKIPAAVMLIFSEAFTPSAATGGFAGAGIWIGIRMGVARGIFSNESGLGTAAIVAAAARTKEPAAQALVSMTQTFIDTLVVCTMTALVILVTGSWTSGLNGAELTSHAFTAGLPGEWGGIVVSVSLSAFAYSTLLGWCYYGEKGIESLFGVKALLPYRLLFCLLVPVGAMAELAFVWTFSDVCNALMAFPNLLALLLLSPKIREESTAYLRRLGRAGG